MSAYHNKKKSGFTNLNIRIQLRIGFAGILLCVLAMGAISTWQSKQIHAQTEVMYNHPLKVRRSIAMLRTKMYKMQLSFNQLRDTKNPADPYVLINSIEIANTFIQNQFINLRHDYLGPQTDIDSTEIAYSLWKTMIDESIVFNQLDKIQHHEILITQTKKHEEVFNHTLDKIQVIDDFAVNKADELIKNSTLYYKKLNRNLYLITFTVLGFIFLFIYLLTKTMQTPIQALIKSSTDFQNGNLDAKCDYASDNEFGILAQSFNSLTEKLKLNLNLNKKTAALADLMLSNNDTQQFFHSTLKLLLSYTNAQMAAIYLCNNDDTAFELVESIGLESNVSKSFSATHFEGEFGNALATGKMQHIKNIPKNTRFLYNTVSGRMYPSEIITLPLIVEKRTIAILSLASVNPFNTEAIQLVDNIGDTLSARISGVLLFNKTVEFSRVLELQNKELEVQRLELSSQTTELQTQNTELEIQKNQLNEASKLKTSFLSNMSHELRTPLNSVIALSGVLNRRLSKLIPEEEHSYLEVIERNGKHLLSLINDILDISRIEAGREEIDNSNFDINTVINDVVNMIKPQALQKNIELKNITPDKKIIITNDVRKCQHILQNIIGNAIKFTEKGKIEVETLDEENQIQIIVTDTGIGISEENLKHIFSEFRQADGSTSRKYGGSGLGLAIAQKYAHLLGGSIEVKSKLGEGSIFIISLPKHLNTTNKEPIQEATPIEQPARKSSVQKEIKNKTVLIVEDSEPAIIQIKDILERYNYTVLTAKDGADALEQINKKIPDAIILDLMMPEMDGFKVLQTIRDAELTAHVPVLILTAKHITPDELKMLKRNNVHQLIQKGDVNASELLSAIFKMTHPIQFTETTPPIKPQKIIGKAKILLVEDNPDNMLTAQALLSSKYDTLEAWNGKEAIEMANKHLPNLILMDIALPEIDGIEAFKAIRNNPQLEGIPIIALTASAMTSDRELILAHGFNGYIAKPIDEKLFFKTINEILHGK